jgi:endo-1,4-beta-xylanase
MHNGSRYRVSMWAKLAPGEPDAMLRVSIQRTYGGQTNYETLVAGKTVTADEWVHFEGDYLFAYDTDSLSIYVESSAAVGNPPRHPSFYIDDFGSGTPAAADQPLTPVKDAAAVLPRRRHRTGADGRPALGALLRRFNSVTAENAMKFSSISPQNLQLRSVDTLATSPRSHGLTMRGTRCCGTSRFGLCSARTERRSSRASIATAPRRLSRTSDGGHPVQGRSRLVGRRQQAIDASQPDGLRVTPWPQIIGPDYIDKAFDAREYAGPDAKLYLNEFSTTDPTKRQALLGVVEGMLERGVPLDGVGHQMHINVYQPAVAEIRTTLETFGDLGLDNQITEMDMSVYSDTTTSYDPIPPEPSCGRGIATRDLQSCAQQTSSAR